MLATLALASATLPAKIDDLLAHPALKGSLTSVCITKPDGEIIYAQNAETRVMPASNEKILTCFYALSVLGPDYKPKTRFWKVGNDIYVHAEGDPLLTEAQLRQVRSQLKPTPDTRILVKQDFAPGFGFGWEHDDLPHAYAARITALTIDGGRFVVKAQNATPVVPAYTGVTLRYAKSNQDPQITYDRERGLLTVTGKVPATSDNLERFALPSPARAAATILGGKYFVADGLPATASGVTIQGKSIGELAKLCLEPSDNSIAEHLLLMAARKEGDLGDNEFATASVRMAKFYEEKVGLAPGLIRPMDGSGLSRHNLVTTKGLAQILRHIYRTELRNLFLEALPAPGEGTLRSRLAGIPVFAKTGTLSSASALSGYVMIDNEPVVFSIVMNHYLGSSSQVRSIQDQIVKEIASMTTEKYNESIWCASPQKNLPDPSAPLAPRNWLY